MSIHLSTPIEKLTRVGKVTASRLARLNIVTAKDLLEHYPARFEDYSAVLSVESLSSGKAGSMFGVITDIENKKTSKKHMNITEAWLDDGTGLLRMVWFNQPYLTETLRPGDRVAIAGKAERDFNGWVLKNPSYEKTDSPEKTVHTARLVPVYPLTAGITQKQIRFLVHQALSAAHEYTDILPPDIIQNAQLIPKPKAIQAIHLPESIKQYEAARRRLTFEELFLIQLLVQQAKSALASFSAPRIPFNETETKKLVASLPFSLTNGQRKAAWTIIQNMEQGQPMNRLLQGDVGAGKTVVAAIASLNAAAAGFQSALMAPTELLALQHYKTIASLFPDKPIALLTSKHARLSTDKEATKPTIIELLSGGAIPMAIGTHAIIQQGVSFDKLGLVIVDEQHRFGVKQRKELTQKTAKKDAIPHFLSMTATPIPRTLALSLYGDLDITTIKELPIGRKRIITKLAEEQNRKKAYQFIQEKIDQGRQIFVICPLINESDGLGVKSATAEFEKLKTAVFPRAKIGLLHGRMKSQEKEQVMNDFAENRAQILVSTSVVEVGVDIPNATVMMIEGADRFGLASLHQFRGRVGRGGRQSYCFLFTDSKSAQTRSRLASFVQARDGFEIAELDLALRGHGELYGTEQSGTFETLRIASLSDAALIEEVQSYAQRLIADDPSFAGHPSLAQTIESQNKTLHFE